MDIVLNTYFDSQRFPLAPLPGFVDDFERPASENLGATLDGKTWEYSGIPWQLTGQGTATGHNTSPLAYVDALTSSGTITAVVGQASSPEADPRGGVAFRIADSHNYLYLSPNTRGTLTLYVRLNNDTHSAQTLTGQSLASGDELTIELNGPEISVQKNQQPIITTVIHELVSETRHGFYSHTQCDTTWDSIEFVAD